MIRSSPSIDQLSKVKSKSDQNLQRSTALSPDMIESQISMKRSLSGSKIARLLSFVPEVSINWFMQILT